MIAMISKKYLLRNIPLDIFKFILVEQNKIKEHKNISQYSLEQTVYGLLRETEKFKKFIEDGK